MNTRAMRALVLLALLGASACGQKGGLTPAAEWSPPGRANPESARGR